jgi:hypothetical protein
VDAGIGYLLFRYAGLGAACFYLLNPICILITGYHSQIDNLAVLCGLASCLLLGSSRRFNRLGTAVLLGLSLATKHILFLFPVWVFFGTAERLSLRSRFAWACAAYAIPAIFFAAYALAYPGSIAGIWSHAIQYRGLAFAAGSSGASPLDSAASGLLPMLVLLITAPFTAAKGLSFPVIGNPTAIWIVCMLTLGIITRRFTAIERLNAYLVGITLTTPTIADQYLAIPLVACAMVWTARSVWVYTGVGTAFLLLISFSNMGHALGMSLFYEPSPAPHLLRCICQIPLIFVLKVLLRPLWERPVDSKLSEGTRSDAGVVYAPPQK